MPKIVNIMATPLGGGPTYIGNASQVCTTLWGNVPSGYPRNISMVLKAARDGSEYRGYTVAILPRDLVVLQSTIASTAVASNP